MLVDRGLLRTDRASVGAFSSAPPPESVQAIVAARLDALSHEEKQPSRRPRSWASRSGWGRSPQSARTRWSSSIGSTSSSGKHLIRRGRDSIVLSEPQFSFPHIVVRDVAYEQIPLPPRPCRTSCRAASMVEALSPERGEDRSEMLAHHYLSALQYVSATDPRETPSPSRRNALREAGDPVAVAERIRQGGRVLRGGAGSPGHRRPRPARRDPRSRPGPNARRERRRRPARGSPRRLPRRRSAREGGGDDGAHRRAAVDAGRSERVSQRKRCRAAPGRSANARQWLTSSAISRACR